MYDLRVGLEDVAGSENVDRLVVNGAASALHLDSAAVFALMPDGGFLRQAAVGWHVGTAWHLFSDDAVVERLTKGSRVPIRLAENAWTEVQVPNGPARPILAVPLGVKRSAFAIYGAHVDGRDIDPDETRGLMDLCAAAAAIRAA